MSHSIYISTAGVAGQSIQERVLSLARAGVKNIELSGGTAFNNTIEADLKRLQQKFQLCYQCHNYFPPPRKDFVFNLASLSEETFQASVAHAKRALEFCDRFEIAQMGFHAGFLFELSIAELADSVAARTLVDPKKALERFQEGWAEICEVAEKLGITLYLENNILTARTKELFGDQLPFFLITATDYFELQTQLRFSLLLDVAHLTVSSHSLRIDPMAQLSQLLPETEYIHLSGTDGLSDTNEQLPLNQPEFTLVQQHLVTRTSKVMITLEVTGTAAELAEYHHKVDEVLSD